ncbi:pancreatic lipase-related protein 2-like [Ptychodera flava]|uniref:pancreatic lipase-related protein 2-like n=1 Tax=Ptychodera flava TaxID=63121 RepID=UPI00396A7AFB
MILSLCALLSLATLGMADTVCYPELDDRCFTNDPPYDNTNQLPEDPATVGTAFQLFTRQNYNTGQFLDRHKPEALEASNFDAQRMSVFIIHGWLNHGDIFWMHNVKDALLDFNDYNVFLVDWSGGARAGYFQSVANTRIVGAESDLFAKFLYTQTGQTFGDMYCVGHSLGGHCCGYFGEGTPFLGRITGLDPAGPNFEDEHVLVRLDPRDAQFVDVIHTDAERLIELGLGIYQECGHVDFYPNGGKDQPGCDRVGSEVCDHTRAVEYYLHSITPSCKFTAYPCELEQWSNCNDCGTRGCNYMGHPATPDNQGVYYLETSDSVPYCLG